MADRLYRAGVAVGSGAGFELTLSGAEGGAQRFDLALADIPELVQSLAAIGWASAAKNRPAAGTILPKVHAFPVKSWEVGLTGDAQEPVMVVELFGGVRLGLHLTRDAAREAAASLAKVGGGGAIS